MKPYYLDSTQHAALYLADTLDCLQQMPSDFVDMMIADPPYFLSNGGTTCQSGERVKVNKGNWDTSQGLELNHQFNLNWLESCQRVLKPNGTIWVSGTHHNIFSIGYAMQHLGYKILNDIVWQKPNPPPNLSCRYFTHSTETILWAAKNSASKHYFNYDLMREINGDKQMKTVWTFTAPGAGEKVFGRHPTQKPVALLERMILAGSVQNAIVLDPFCGSGSTGVAALKQGRRFIGIDRDEAYLQKLAIPRLQQVMGESGAGATQHQQFPVSSFYLNDL